MPPECIPDLFDFARVGGCRVEASFNGGLITSDAGGLLLGSTDRAIGLVDQFARCFTDHRDPRLIEHEVRTLVGQRVLGLALGYEDLNDHYHANPASGRTCEVTAPYTPKGASPE